MTNQLPPTPNPGLKQTLVSKKLRDRYRCLLTLHYRQYTVLDDFLRYVPKRQNKLLKSPIIELSLKIKSELYESLEAPLSRLYDLSKLLISQLENLLELGVRAYSTIPRVGPDDRRAKYIDYEAATTAFREYIGLTKVMLASAIKAEASVITSLFHSPDPLKRLSALEALISGVLAFQKIFTDNFKGVSLQEVMLAVSEVREVKSVVAHINLTPLSIRPELLLNYNLNPIATLMTTVPDPEAAFYLSGKDLSQRS